MDKRTLNKRPSRFFHYSVRIPKQETAFEQWLLSIFSHLASMGQWLITLSLHRGFHFSRHDYPCSFKNCVFHAKPDVEFWRLPLTTIYKTKINDIKLISRIFLLDVFPSQDSCFVPKGLCAITTPIRHTFTPPSSPPSFPYPSWRRSHR